MPSHSPPERRARHAAREATPRPVVEEAVLHIIRDEAQQHGYVIYPPASGFADLLLSHQSPLKPTLAVWVLGSVREPTRAQRHWLQALESHRVAPMLVRPSDYQDLLALLGGRR